jgi:hypothetical protein
MTQLRIWNSLSKHVWSDGRLRFPRCASCGCGKRRDSHRDGPTTVRILCANSDADPRIGPDRLARVRMRARMQRGVSRICRQNYRLLSFQRAWSRSPKGWSKLPQRPLAQGHNALHSVSRLDTFSALDQRLLRWTHKNTESIIRRSSRPSWAIVLCTTPIGTRGFRWPERGGVIDEVTTDRLGRVT